MRKKKSSSPSNSGPSLPAGWEKHEDAEGAYFWHVKSGTIQRERPSENSSSEDGAAAVVKNVRSSRIFEDDFDVFDYTAAAAAPINKKAALPKSCTSGSIVDIGGKEKSVVLRKIPDSSNSTKSNTDWKRRSMPTPTEAILEESYNASTSSSPSSSSAVHATMQVGWYNLQLRPIETTLPPCSNFFG